MRIAIVDDIKEDRNQIKHLTAQYLENRKNRFNLELNFAEFDSGEAFLTQFSKGRFDLVFLDIYMKELTGIDVAKRIAVKDKEVNIIFITTSEEHLLDGYEVHAAGYIIKPVITHMPALHFALDYVLDRRKSDSSSVTVFTEYGELKLSCGNILYMDCMNRKLYLHLVNNILLVEGKFNDYRNLLLDDPRFLECYRNLIVNMDYIDTPNGSDFLLLNGEQVPISRRKKNDVIALYMKYFITGNPE